MYFFPNPYLSYDVFAETFHTQKKEKKRKKKSVWGRQPAWEISGQMGTKVSQNYKHLTTAL